MGHEGRKEGEDELEDVFCCWIILVLGAVIARVSSRSSSALFEDEVEDDVDDEDDELFCSISWSLWNVNSWSSTSSSSISK